MAIFFQQLLTGSPFPFLFTQQRRHVTPKITAEGLYRALMDRVREASFALQPCNEFMETDFSA